eukprot:1394752-Prymnesium_polylepis.2
MWARRLTGHSCGVVRATMSVEMDCRSCAIERQPRARVRRDVPRCAESGAASDGRCRCDGGESRDC